MARPCLLGASSPATRALASLVGTFLLLTGCSSSDSGAIVFLADGDGDGLPDTLEARLGSDPADADSPYPGGDLDTPSEFGPGPDAIPDGLESYLLERVAGPITASTDTDLDGLPDYVEIRIESDPRDFRSPYSDGALDTDGPTGPSGDGISD